MPEPLATLLNQMSSPAGMAVPLKLPVIDETVDGTVRSSSGSNDGRQRVSGRRPLPRRERRSFITDCISCLSLPGGETENKIRSGEHHFAEVVLEALVA